MERRKFTRILFSCEASLNIDEETIPVKVIDLSLNGALVEITPPKAAVMDKQAELSIKLDDEILIKMEVTVRHIEGDHTGLHCDHFDLDSATHLRRLVELNVGDDEILNRELSQLGA